MDKLELLRKLKLRNFVGIFATNSIVRYLMLSDSSPGESSVLRVKLRVVKNPSQMHISGSEYALAEVEYNAHHFLLVHIRNGLMRIRQRDIGCTTSLYLLMHNLINTIYSYGYVPKT